MKKVVIIYNSYHHCNTKKLLISIQEECKIDLFVVSEAKDINFSNYDIVGFASGIYMGKFHRSIITFIENHTDELKDIFLIYTSGRGKKDYDKNLKENFKNKNLNFIGTYSCKGYDTYGPLKIIGGISKKHPNELDLINGIKFVNEIINN